MFLGIGARLHDCPGAEQTSYPVDPQVLGDHRPSGPTRTDRAAIGLSHTLDAFADVYRTRLSLCRDETLGDQILFETVLPRDPSVERAGNRYSDGFVSCGCERSYKTSPPSFEGLHSLA